MNATWPARIESQRGRGHRIYGGLGGIRKWTLRFRWEAVYRRGSITPFFQEPEDLMGLFNIYMELNKICESWTNELGLQRNSYLFKLSATESGNLA
jgi:hypothetical protein